MTTQQLHALYNAFRDFYCFAPMRQNLNFMLMLAQGLTAGIGLLLIIPLLHIIGFDVSNNLDSAIAANIRNVFLSLGIPLTLGPMLVVYIAVVGTIASLRYCLSVNTVTIQQRYICHLRSYLYQRLLNCRWQFIVEHKTSDFIHCLSGQVQAVGHAGQLMISFLSQLTLSAFMVVIAFSLSWKISTLTIAFAIIFIFFLLPLNRKIANSGKHQLITFKSIFQLLTEHLESLKMIKAYASEEYHTQQLVEMSKTLEAQHVLLTKANAFTQWTFMIGGIVAFSVFFYVSQSILYTPLPTTLLLLIISARLLPQFISLQKTYQQLLHKLPSFSDVNEMRQRCNEAQEKPLPQACPIVLNNEIRLEDVCFQYPSMNHPVFEALNIRIKKNETVAIVGPSGAGKSTLADLIAGLLKPDVGTFYCDDTPIVDSNRLAWRRSVAYVTQEVHLFHDSIRENLRWVAPDTVDDDLWEVLNIAAAHSFVSALPNKLDTIVGDRGIRLSGGERQRLALARALLSKPQVLILDEATSALDPTNEAKIQTALKNLQGKLTILIIAHRDTTIAHADKCIRLTK